MMAGSLFAGVLEGFGRAAGSGCSFEDRNADAVKEDALDPSLTREEHMPHSDLKKLQQENAELHQRIRDLEQQLLQAEKLSSVGVLAFSITHEFNNILTTVINYAKIGLRNKQTESRDKAFDRILAAGQRASKITTGMLSYARSRPDRRESMSLAQLVADIMMLVEKDLQKHRVEWHVDVESEPHAIVNASQIQQVILNLIINARQAMPDGGTLVIRIRRNEAQAVGEIEVSDSGAGIPAETLPKIFDRFFTTKTTDAAGQGGTGLGLALCREVIEAHEGRIRVESAVGRGTRFTLKLPLADGPTPPSPAPESVNHSAG